MRNQAKMKYTLLPIVTIVFGYGPGNLPAEQASVDKPLQVSMALANPQPDQTLVSDCVPVAKIHKRKNIDQISIQRKGQTVSLTFLPNRELCAGDKVIVPNTLSGVKVEYYSHPAKTVHLNAGDLYQVEADLCGVFCKLTNSITNLVQQLTTGGQEELTVTASCVTASCGGGGRPEDLPISMSLDAAQGPETPFYLFSRPGAIELVWEGQQPPYQLEVTAESGQMIVQETVNTNTFSLTLPNTESNQRYNLRISEAGSDEVYQKPLVFAVPPFPLDPKANPYQVFATLLALDCGEHAQKNWRLEIWRQLHQLPDSPQKESFKGHLLMDYFDLDEVGLCD